LTDEAEAWAEAGTRKENEVVVRPATRPLRATAYSPWDLLQLGDRKLMHYG